MSTNYFYIKGRNEVTYYDTDNIDKQQATRHNKGKLRWSLVDFKSLEDLVKVLEFGAKKYGDDNWKKGLPTTEICESMLRHTFAFMQGEDNDTESGISHIGHIMCNVMFLAHMIREKKEFDNRINRLSQNEKVSADCCLL